VTEIEAFTLGRLCRSGPLQCTQNLVFNSKELRF
jgi:hypothetical protein